MHTRLNLPKRPGPKPDTTSSLPHSQLTQHGPQHIIDKLHGWCFSLPNVNDEESGISVPGSRALVLHDGLACNHEAFMIGREFAHIHPHPDNGSMHVKLPADDAQAVIDRGWGESHYLVTQGHYPIGLVMVFSPRDDAELEAVQKIVTRSYEYATGKSLSACMTLDHGGARDLPKNPIGCQDHQSNIKGPERPSPLAGRLRQSSPAAILDDA